MHSHLTFTCPHQHHHDSPQNVWQESTYPPLPRSATPDTVLKTSNKVPPFKQATATEDKCQLALSLLASGDGLRGIPLIKEAADEGHPHAIFHLGA